MPNSHFMNRRRAGVLLHITSLPCQDGPGTLGQSAIKFLDYLQAHGFTVWQTLPVNPTQAGGSPYQCNSVHAGDPHLIDTEGLFQDGLIDGHALATLRHDADGRHRLREMACATLLERLPDDSLRTAFSAFHSTHAWWLEDYAWFTALKQYFHGAGWQHWPAGLRDRDPSAMDALAAELAPQRQLAAFEQFMFFRQWQHLRDAADSRGILLFGDMPIFVADDSADVWAGRQYFDLLPDGQPRVVAGVPPDYFSATGQRWGNPHYRWDVMEHDQFGWWVGRMRTQLELYHLVRIDHFRGFESYWEIPADAETAMSGHWVSAPGRALLQRLQTVFGTQLPLVAEDLGIITEEVNVLRQAFHIPGMRVLQFAFDGCPDNAYLPHNYDLNTVVYTGTHDNDTTLGWFGGQSPEQQGQIYAYMGESRLPMPEALMHTALASLAPLAILPMQDILRLDGHARMNTPGTVGGSNWRWQFQWWQLDQAPNQLIHRWNRMYGRCLDNV